MVDILEMFVFIFIVLITVLIVFANVEFLKRTWRFQRLKIPSVGRCLPGLGHLHLILFLDEVERLRRITAYCHKFTRMAKCWIGMSPLILVSHPDIFQKVLTSEKCLEKQKFLYGLLALEDSLLIAKKDTWKNQRRILNHSFGIKLLQNFIPTFSSVADELIESLSYKVDAKTFDLHPDLTKTVFKTLIVNLFGAESQIKLKDELFKLMEYIDFILQVFSERLKNPLLYSDTLFNLTKLGKEDKKIREFGFDLLRRLYEDRALQFYNNEQEEEEKTLMDSLVQNPEKFNGKEIVENLALLLIAGYDTTASTVSSAILMLAMHPEVQDKLYAHIEEELVEFTEENLNKLQYLNQVLNETMRLFPSGPVILRTSSDELEIDGELVPKGVDFMLNFYALHRNKAVWGDDAEKFDPDRFSPKIVEARHPYAFLPFSGGRRNCIGYRYGCLSMRVMLVKILKEYKVTTHLKLEDIRIGCDILLNKSPGTLVTLSRRNQ